MKVKVHGGTTRHGDPPLCLTCRYATVASGPSSRHQIIECDRLSTPITFPVTSCSVYLHKQHPSLLEMEDMAWILRTDARRKQIGFVQAKDLRPKDRYVLTED